MKIKGLRLLSAFILIGLSIVFSKSALYAQEMPPAQVQTTIVTKQLLAPKIDLKGNVISLQNSIVGAEVAGQLMRIGMVGTQYNEGESIAQINDEELVLRLEMEKANLRSLEADLVFRNSEVERFSTLAERDNASKTQLQQAIADRDMLNQEIIVAQLRIAAVKRGLVKSKVPAPFSGMLTKRHAQKGEYINVGQSIAQLVDTVNIEISVSTPIAYLRLLNKGDELKVASSDKEYSLKVRDIVAVGDQQTRTAEVRLSAKGTELVVGESVSVFMPRSLAQVHTIVPRDAIVIRGAQTFVYRAIESTAEQVPVEIIFADGDRVAVNGQLTSEDRVIVRGAERLQPGSPIVEL